MSEVQPKTSAATTQRRSRSRSKNRSSADVKPIRAWCPGSYDTLHFGHINFLRKVKHEMLTRFPKVEVIVGLFSDQDLIATGQQPVFSLDERYEMLRANKWVDSIVKGAPFELSKNVLKENNCDYAFCSVLDHSIKFDDKLHHELLECGLLKMIAVSKNEYPGISTSHIVNRMLLFEPRDENNNTPSGRNWFLRKNTFPDSISCKEIVRFTTGNIPKPNDKVVYVDGSFDLLHPGHLNLLKRASKLGNFLYVGLHSDEDISKYAGRNYPVLDWNERLMALLSCKYVSEVVIDAPVGVDKNLLKDLSIDVVVPSIYDYYNGSKPENVNTKDRYEAAKELGIFHIITADDNNANNASLASLTTADILNRVHQNWTDFNYILDKSILDVENDFNKVNLLQNRDDGDVLKFPSSVQ